MRCVFAGLLFPAMLSLTAGGDPTDNVKLQVVKHKEFLKAMEGLRGKVVVVDVWGDFCIPCKEEFPHLVELHAKYVKKDVACVSVSVDPVEDKEKALRFLQKQKAVFGNFLLDEAPKVWQDHFDIYGVPAVFVYDRDGKLAARFDLNEVGKKFSYMDVEKAVEKLLAK
jgi:thiol-disulfide isomerase/thioredoxin